MSGVGPLDDVIHFGTVSDGDMIVDALTST
jgi:hypothetical protein